MYAVRQQEKSKMTCKEVRGLRKIVISMDCFLKKYVLIKNPEQLSMVSHKQLKKFCLQKDVIFRNRIKPCSFEDAKDHQNDGKVLWVTAKNGKWNDKTLPYWNPLSTNFYEYDFQPEYEDIPDYKLFDEKYGIELFDEIEEETEDIELYYEDIINNSR